MKTDIVVHLDTHLTPKRYSLKPCNIGYTLLKLIAYIWPAKASKTIACKDWSPRPSSLFCFCKYITVII